VRQKPKTGGKKSGKGVPPKRGVGGVWWVFEDRQKPWEVLGGGGLGGAPPPQKRKREKATKFDHKRDRGGGERGHRSFWVNSSQ